MQSAQPLKLLPETTNLIEVSTTITHNYGMYATLAAQLTALQEWVTRTREESLNVIHNNQANK